MITNEATILTRHDLALRFQVHDNTIKNWEKKGLPVIHIGGLCRYDLAEVMKWVNLDSFAKEKLA
jgi:phage terminase Nu1 subunit (DNA packaging protein)